MSFTDDQIKALSAPLDKANVKSRTQAGRELSYVEAWHAIAEANRIFGFDAWDRTTVEMRLLGEPRLTGDKWRVGYMAKVRIKVRAISPSEDIGRSNEVEIIREGCGFGSGIDKDPDQAHESALKEAESDAMKRALMTFGNPFGLALYDKTQANVVSGPPPVPVTERGLYVACKAAIDLCEGEAALTGWAKDNDVSMGRIKAEDPDVYHAVRTYWANRLGEFRAKTKVAA